MSKTYEAWKDDRSAEQLQTHTWIVAGRDKFLSSWGPGKQFGGSTAAWSCRPEHARKVLDWVEGRSDMRDVRDTNAGALRRVRGLVHIYVVGPGHPALGGES